jgi:hypothetical protein
MDAFERLVGGLLERNGYWVKYSFKVELSRTEKRRIGRPSCPRWEIDVLAYKPASNELLAVECKSYLDSPGVRYAAIASSDHRRSDRYKLFNDALLRRTVLRRLTKQLERVRSCRKSPKVRLCLAAGRVVSEKDRERLKSYFDSRGWLFFDKEWIRAGLEAYAGGGFENDVVAVVAKLLLRGTSSPATRLKDEDAE